MIGVYKIEHTASGRFYVGHSISMRKRWHVHRSKLTRGVHHCRRLQHAWTKHGADAFTFTVVEECACQADAAATEQHWLDTYVGTGMLFNSLSVNTPLDALRDARKRARSADSVRKRIETTTANDSWCAGQRRRVGAHRLSDGRVVTFRSVRDAARELGISSGNISAVCNGIRMTAGGYSFYFCFEEQDRIAMEARA